MPSPPAAEVGSEKSTPPVSEAKPAQPEASGWNSAIFAPKPAIINSKASETSVKSGDLVEPGPDVIDPVLIEHPKLKYPKEAKKRKVEMVVSVRVLVDEKGAVLEAKIEKPVGHGLDEAATKIALGARFIPATKGTVPVKIWTVLPLDYRLQK
jgi:TonB family protein